MADQETEAKPNETPAVEEDEELSALLESAAKDFDAPNVEEVKESKKDLLEEVPNRPPPDNLWSDDFMKQASQQLSSLFSGGADGQFNMDELGEEISRLAEASTHAAGFDASTPDAEFADIFAQTLRSLSEGTDNLPTEEGLMNMMGNMDEGNGEPVIFLKFMQKMMENLLSKEIIYPALSGYVEKYPAWLEENRATLSAEDLSRYETQFSKMKLVCEELDKETPDDNSDVKKERLDKIVALMQEISNCGQPPAELGNDGEGEKLQLPPGMSPDQCSLQ